MKAETAIKFARKYFPEGPEKLAEHLKVTVRFSRLGGCDGWCLTTGKRTIIHINSARAKTSQRFTLAHELGHLILGIPSIIGESIEDMLSSNSAEERQVNDFAAEILIPADVVKASLPDLPVIAPALRKLAKKANVSELAAAIRVCNLANEIGMMNASVVLFDGDRVRWQWSKTLKMHNQTAIGLLAKSRKAVPQAFRHLRPQGDVIVASTIENPYFGSATLFVQLLPSEVAMNLSPHEKRKQLEQIIFANDVKLQQRMSGLMGAHKQRVAGMTKEEAEAQFWERHRVSLHKTRINSKEGREYVRLRISEWY
jgi:Zn-dependent peptidase ImmA (M78 family)